MAGAGAARNGGAMIDSVYRDPLQPKRAALAELQERASALAAQVNRIKLTREFPDRLATLDYYWGAADAAITRACDAEGLDRACAACAALIADLETVISLPEEVFRQEVYERNKVRAVRGTQVVCVLAGFALIPLNFFVWMGSTGDPTLFRFLAVLQTILGATAFSAAFFASRRDGSARGIGFLGFIVACGGPIGLWLAAVVSGFFSHMDFGGGAWGRPLRLRGKVLHPQLRAGADWTRGARPDSRAVDPPTRAALEALWLHDAQKEHASVPALSRVSWLLAAVGAPADLVEAVHVAALEEIEHTRLCFALAAGYGGRSHTVEPMPELLVGGLDLAGDPLARIATESLNDGCLLEDFNADVAALCAEACREPVVREVLARIAREERSHADLSWRLLAFALERGGPRTARATEKALAALERVPRPTAASAVNRARVDGANPATMRAHGRLPDTEWAPLWSARVAETRRRVEAILRGNVSVAA
jgi:hypothetical protein